jgi:hypothetical protein
MNPVKPIIVDYGAGNLRSVARAVARAGYDPLITSEASAVERAEVVILPGVGAAADTMSNLTRCGLVEPIRQYIAGGRPFLGVCMGLQALFTVSEEGGEHRCLDVLPGRVLRLPAGLKVPHMGWTCAGAATVFEDTMGPSLRRPQLLRGSGTLGGDGRPATASPSRRWWPRPTLWPPSSTRRRAASPASACTRTSCGWPATASFPEMGRWRG